MSWVVPLALGGVAILVMAVFTTLAARRSLHARPATLVGPRILVHDINDDRCTGCDACVAVCPTNVLDLVKNKSRVLRFHDCIQCEACMWACPTEALVMFPEGSTPPPLKIPEIDEHFQTAVPGQYLIGEVAGKPLVKNAANLGRMVIEHAISTGLRPGGGMAGAGAEVIDVAIVGSGPGGLSAALTCIARGLSYVMLEKEQLIASTIARYPKGKLVMCEPYDTRNLSYLPAFDSSKEQLIPIWRELIERVGVRVKLGESVESVSRGKAGAFDVKTTVAHYRAQRVVLAIGTRGKPRTLGVPGENLPKVYNLLEDPADWRGRGVLVVGGGDSAVEAALALADAGAKVLVSYRGKAFSRCQPKNKQAIESYAAQGRIKTKLMSQVVSIDEASVIIQMGDGGHKKYANDGVLVLIGSDPPIAWLEKLSVRFVDRPHQFQLGKTDDLVRHFVPAAVECPEDAARAAAQVLGGKPSDLDRALGVVGLPAEERISGPRKWLRAATSILSGTNAAAASRDRPRGQLPRERGKLDGPVPLSEFAKRQRTNHTGSGRRDQLSPGERTRVLRMLRDEGGRLADEDSQVFIGSAPHRPGLPFDLDDDSPALAPVVGSGRRSAVEHAPDAKQAVIVGLAQAMAKGPANKRAKRPSEAPPPAPDPSHRARRPSAVPPPGAANRRHAPPPFSEEPTRQVTNELLHSLRHGGLGGAPFEEDPTHHPGVDPEATRMAGAAPADPFGAMFDDDDRGPAYLPGTSRGSPNAVTGRIDLGPRDQEFAPEEATRMANIEGLLALERANSADRGRGGAPPEPPRRRNEPQPPSREEATRAVDLRKEPRSQDGSLADIDWDLD